MTVAGARWRVVTPTSAPGAVAAIEITGTAWELDQTLQSLGIAPVKPAEVALRRLADVDSGLVARWSEECMHLMPHGGQVVVRELAHRISAAGFIELRALSAQDLHRAYPDAADEIEARMLVALATAASPRAIDLLLDQPRRWRLFEQGSLQGPDEAHSALLRRLIDPPLVVAIGGSNIGKSTLANALAGRHVSIVADEPGTTRDHVGVTLDLGGLVVRYVDTPGMRTDADDNERAASEAAARVLDAADLVLCCGDAQTRPPDQRATGGRGASITVALRTDLGIPTGWEPDAMISCQRGEGLRELGDLIRRTLVPDTALNDARPWRFWNE